MNHLSHIEPLEDRIAPATILNPYTVSFSNDENNGATSETAIVHFSKPLFKNPTAAANILIFTTSDGSVEKFQNNNVSENLTDINLLGRHDAQGMDISVSVIPEAGIGNLEVDVVEIEAASFSSNQVSQNIDLGHVYIQGNLQRINVGDNFSTPALKSLSVRSMEIVDTSITDPAQSFVLGPIGSLTVQGDVDINLDMLGYQYGSINKLFIGGTLGGDSAGDQGTGVIQFSGHIRTATIGNIVGTSVSGADNTDTGELVGLSTNASRIGSIHILGSITGGAGQDSGRIFAQSIVQKVVVDGSVTGGAGQDSGEIAGPLGTVSIAGNLTGGSGIFSGSVLSESFNTLGKPVPAAAHSVFIGADVTGGSAGVAATAATSTTAATAATPGDSGVIMAASATSVVIGGSLIGGAASGTSQTADSSGSVLVNSLKTLVINKNITGGSGPDSGVVTGIPETVFGVAILPKMIYGNIVVNGDVSGGAGAASGSLLIGGGAGGTLASLRIGGNLNGSSGTQSGEVSASTSLASLYIGGSVAGGTADNTGEILVGGALTSALIKGSLTGNSTIDTTAVVGDTGYIKAGHIGALAINGGVTSGLNSGGETANNGAIRSDSDIVSLNIGGAVTGTRSNPVIISATSGPATTGKAKTDLAIQSVMIGGNATFLDLLAGYNTDVSSGSDAAGAPLGTPTDDTAQIGAVTIAGNLSATNIVAGAITGSSGRFGTASNAPIDGGGKAGLHSIIASIIIDGAATGDSTPADAFGFVAQEVQAVKVGGTSITLSPGVDNDHLVPVPAAGSNLFVNEVSSA